MSFDVHLKQPESFEFSKENLQKANDYIAKYPENRQMSAVLPILYLAQKQEGWVSRPAIEQIAQMLGCSPMKVLEVATFYTMFNLAPVGKYLVQICETTPCWLRGSSKIKDACSKKLGIDYNETTKDKLFTLKEVECLGACANAPLVQINDDYFEDLDEESILKLLEDLQNGKEVKIGSQIGRRRSEPFGSNDNLENPKPSKASKKSK